MSGTGATIPPDKDQTEQNAQPEPAPDVWTGPAQLVVQAEQAAQEQPDLDPLDIAVPAPATPNYGGIPNFGPNDAVQYPWPKPLENSNAFFGRYRLPMTPGPIEPYPAGIQPEDIGVIDPSLIGLRATPVQLPTPRGSVTTHIITA